LIHLGLDSVSDGETFLQFFRQDSTRETTPSVGLGLRGRHRGNGEGHGPAWAKVVGLCAGKEKQESGRNQERNWADRENQSRPMREDEIKEKEGMEVGRLLRKRPKRLY
jgi:hypothetical protein